MTRGDGVLTAELLAMGDPALATMAEAGHEQAFDVLFERHAPRLWGYALAVTGEPAEAAAVLVETFARVFTTIRAGQVAPGTTFRSLALTIARDTALDRAHGRTAPVERFTYPSDFEASMIGAAFAPLPERSRSVLWLSQIERMRPASIAPVVHLSPEATGALVLRANRGFRQHYLRADIDETGDRNCSRAVSRLVGQIDGTLELADTQKLERHLRVCDACTSRRRELPELGQKLRLLIAPIPANLQDDARTAWSGIVVATATRTGLPPTAEKVLAGVTAVAAAVGVVGAAVLGTTAGRSDAQAATPIAPRLTDISGEPPLALDAPVLLDLPTRSFGQDAFGIGLRPGTSNPATSEGVVGVSAPGPATPATDLGEKLTPPPPLVLPPAPKPEPPADGADAPPATPAEPVIAAGVEVAEVPVAIEVGEDPGATVGPVSVGSEPEVPDAPVEVSGPLAPAAPAAEAVSTVVVAAGL